MIYNLIYKLAESQPPHHVPEDERLQLAYLAEPFRILAHRF